MVTLINSGDSVDYFLGDFFTRKNLLSSRTSLKQNGSALKKLHQFLFEAGEISKKDLIEISESIKIGVQEGEGYMMDEGNESWF